MIHYLKHQDIDKQKWDTCIDQAPNGLIYGDSWYLDIVSPGWHALVEGDYESVMPLTWKKKWGVYYLYQPYFTQRLGVFSLSDNISNIKINKFLSRVPKKFLHVNICTMQKPTTSKFMVYTRPNYELKLSNHIPELLKQYSKNTIRNIKKAKKNGLKLSSSIPFADILMETPLTNNNPRKNQKLIKKVVEKAISLEKGKTFGVYDGTGNLLSGSFVLLDKNRLIYLFSRNSDKAYKSGSSHLLVDKIIGQHAGNNKVFDFEGSMVPGVARFYKGFGAEKREYYQLFYKGIKFWKLTH